MSMAINYARILWCLVQSLWNPWRLHKAQHWIRIEIERRAPFEREKDL